MTGRCFRRDSSELRNDGLQNLSEYGSVTIRARVAIEAPLTSVMFGRIGRSTLSLYSGQMTTITVSATDVAGDVSIMVDFDNDGDYVEDIGQASPSPK